MFDGLYIQLKLIEIVIFLSNGSFLKVHYIVLGKKTISISNTFYKSSKKSAFL